MTGQEWQDEDTLKSLQERMDRYRHEPEEIFVVNPNGEVRRGSRHAPFEPDGYVYILVGGGLVKIGMSRNPEQRIKVLIGTKLPWSVELVHLIPCQNHRLAEKTLHRKYEPHRAHGEWFTLPEEALKDIKRIRAIRNGHIEYLGQPGKR